jgi:hypothetical protein
MNRGKKGKESVQRAKGKWKRFPLAVSRTPELTKRKETMTAVSSGRVYQPVDYQPPLVVDYPPDPVLDYGPDPSSISHPTRPRLPTPPVVDYPPDPSSITHSIRL